jgi:hypothetical protein
LQTFRVNAAAPRVRRYITRMLGIVAYVPLAVLAVALRPAAAQMSVYTYTAPPFSASECNSTYGLAIPPCANGPMSGAVVFIGPPYTGNFLVGTLSAPNIAGTVPICHAVVETTNGLISSWDIEGSTGCANTPDYAETTQNATGAYEFAPGGTSFTAYGYQNYGPGVTSFTAYGYQNYGPGVWANSKAVGCGCGAGGVI